MSNYILKTLNLELLNYSFLINSFALRNFMTNPSDRNKLHFTFRIVVCEQLDVKLFSEGCELRRHHTAGGQVELVTAGLDLHGGGSGSAWVWFNIGNGTEAHRLKVQNRKTHYCFCNL